MSIAQQWKNGEDLYVGGLCCRIRLVPLGDLFEFIAAFNLAGVFLFGIVFIVADAN